MMPNPISFEYLLSQLLRVMNDEIISIRSRALKILAQIVQRNSSLLSSVS
jgi:flagellar biosynthesis/type III secretory pathway chaperone